MNKNRNLIPLYFCQQMHHRNKENEKAIKGRNCRCIHLRTIEDFYVYHALIDNFSIETDNMSNYINRTFIIKTV